ncbi:hypothetical protein M408DRAFT_29167 [Serendipita vermifera MAFF 305830]|uniref:SEC7 domain-containing protein n=1 Tax=Serendipita vermifera MAFF 305830 TaxID=933852 RepID=A0A0C2WX30_SERVB|nr:hypothetical protein M408DRAFT_29167 [Serendipita vermifera MAFF 305830]
MASFLRPPHKQQQQQQQQQYTTASSSTPSSSPPSSSARNPPPTSYMAVSNNTRRAREPLSPPGMESTKLAHRTSRVDLDFEQALASHDTFRLHEGPDIATMGKESDHHHHSQSGEQSMQANAAGGGDGSRPNTATRRLKKIQHGANPSLTQISIQRPQSSSSPRASLSEYSSVGGSPTSSHRDLPLDQQQGHQQAQGQGGAGRSSGGAYPGGASSSRQEEVKKRSMFRSAGSASASSPDLGTVVRKKKSGVVPKVPPLPPGGEYDDPAYASTDVTPTTMSNWTAALGGKSKSIKSPRTLRAKTANFLQNIFPGSSNSPGTVRSRPGEQSTPTTPHRTRYDRPFEDSPPVPNLPRGPTNVADIFAPSAYPGAKTERSGKRASKPLPPIARPSTGDAELHHEHEMTVSPVDSSVAGSSSSHAASGLPSTPVRRPPDVIARIQANSGRRRRSMSVGDVDWKPINSPQSASKTSTTSPQNRVPSPSPAPSSLTKPKHQQRPVSANSASANSTTSSGYATAPSQSEATTPVATPSQETTPCEPVQDDPMHTVHTIRPSRDWKNALEGWDHQVANLDIRDPSVLNASLSGDSLGSPTSPTKGRPRSRTQDPMPIPPRLSLNKLQSPGTPTRAGSVGSPPAGFKLPPESSSSSSFGSGTARSPSASLYSTPPSGPPSTSNSFAAQQATVTPTRRGSASAAVPFTGPVIIGTTPASIGHTTTKVTIQRDKDDQHSTTPMNSPKPSTSPSGSTSPHSSPITAHSSQGQRRSSSSNRSSSPQLQLPGVVVPQAVAAAGRAGTSLRVSSLRGTARPALNTLGTPSTSPSNNAGTLRPVGVGSPARGDSYTSQGSPKISVSFTSPSQENLRLGNTSAGGYGSRPNELRAIYGLKNPASASEPTLVPPGASVDDPTKTIRLITSGSRLGNRGGGEFGEELGSTRLSSPASSVKHAFSNASASGTSAGRSSVSRDGSSGANGSGSMLAAEEVEAQGEAIARRIWEEDETFRSKERFAEWLGRPDAINAIARRYYMDNFDFTGIRVDMAFRRLCGKLYFSAESQALDRILIDFSRRYYEHNPKCVLGSASNVHQVVYSLLLLNTDLHVADLAHHMTKQQFISNTLSTLLAPSRASSSAATPARSGSPVQDAELRRKQSLDPVTTPTVNVSDKPGPPISIQNSSIRVKRSGSVNSWKGSLSREATKESINSGSSPSVPLTSPSGTLTENSSLNGSTVSFHESTGRKHTSGQNSVTSLHLQKAWESEVEAYLKDIFAAVRSNQILQPQGGGLSPGGSLGRTPSQRRQANTVGSSKRNSIRGIPSFGINGSNSSFDGRLSPSPSFATSLNDGTTASASALFPPTLGFASNLTKTIIREAQEDDQQSISSDGSNSTDVSITDEELALLGAPWAKEGVLHRKQYWESVGKRAKNKNWMEVFVVIQKGQLNMFTFGSGPSSSGAGAGPAGGVVGGGNWLSNANSVGEHMLAHSLAHVLPPPGLARRPHCFVLTLASGMAFFFQTGTEELANEWVSTCNYWAARQSKEPLAGGVSNMEFGWSRVEADALANEDLDAPPGSFRTLSSKDSSDNFSLRSARSRMGRFDGFSTMRAHPLSDRVYINEWRAPGHSMVASGHDEETQLEALQKQAEKLKADLKTHNDLRDPMIALYAPRSSNLTKATTNWEARSQYLLTEIVKYEKYIESLQGAMKERLKKRGEKALERALHTSSEVTPGPHQRGFGFPDEEAISEDQETETEALTPGANQVQFKTNPVQNLQHKRDAAEATS